MKLSKRQSKLETMFYNMNINDIDQKANNERISKRNEIRKDKLYFHLFNDLSKHKQSNNHYFKDNDDDEKDYINEINDDKESIDIIVDENKHEEVKEVNISDLDKFINTYQTKIKNYTLSLESVFPYRNSLDYSKKYLLKDVDKDLQNILSRFNSLKLYNENTKCLNNKRFDIINLFIKYKTIILDLINTNHTFYPITVNIDANRYNNTFFNKYMIQIKKYADQPTRLSSYFQKFEEFTIEDLKEYKTFSNYIKIDIDKLMYILGIKEFYIHRNRKRI